MRPFFTLLLVAFSLVSSFAQSDQFRSGARTDLAPFYHGVASGDPLSDRVIIWTRVTTSQPTAEVQWRVALDTGMTNIIQSGTYTTDARFDYTVKVDVTGLQAGTFYYYEFEMDSLTSLRGRTLTAPEGDVDSLRFAVVSCSSYDQGHFNAYNRLRERNDIHAILHLGDYYYEYGNGDYGSTRNAQPSTEITSLSDYRTRLSHYRLDSALMRLHQQYPFICVWDDHETANDSWMNGAQNHNSGEGLWADRKSNAVKSYFEWMPVRQPDTTLNSQQIYRKFRYGDLVDLYMLDTRLQGREEQDGTSNTSSSRTLLGPDQFNWLCRGMDTSTAQWQILGQQVMMGELNLNPIFPIGGFLGNEDQWDGYSGERLRLFDSIFTNNIQNMVILTGDIHTSWANDLKTASYNPSTGANSAGVEFVTPSITSPGLNFLSGVGISVAQNLNEHIKYTNLDKHGYYILDINKTRAQADWYYVDKVDAPSTGQSWGDSWYTADQSRHLSHAIAASIPSTSVTVVQAPWLPRPLPKGTPISKTDKFSSVLLGVYPNPFNEQLTLHYTMSRNAEVEAYIYDAVGRLVQTENLGMQNVGIHRSFINTSRLEAGAYVVVLKIANELQQRVIIKK